MELFLTQGFQATTVEQIVATVGVSRRSFFRYFGSKEGVVLGDLVERGAPRGVSRRRPPRRTRAPGTGSAPA